jgi:hypothetical protein
MSHSAQYLERKRGNLLKPQEYNLPPNQTAYLLRWRLPRQGGSRLLPVMFISRNPQPIALQWRAPRRGRIRRRTGVQCAGKI